MAHEHEREAKETSDVTSGVMCTRHNKSTGNTHSYWGRAQEIHTATTKQSTCSLTETVLQFRRS